MHLIHSLIDLPLYFYSVLVPTFKWAQDGQHLFVSIDVPNVEDEKIDLTATSLSFAYVLSAFACLVQVDACTG